MKRFSRFGLVGLLGVAVQLSVLALLTRQFLVPPVTATAIAVETAIVHNFIWHCRFTWRERICVNNAKGTAIRLVRFHAGNGLVSLLGNTALTYCLVDRLNLPELPCTLGSIALCSLVNFASADRWVYQSQPSTGHTM